MNPWVGGVLNAMVAKKDKQAQEGVQYAYQQSVSKSCEAKCGYGMHIYFTFYFLDKVTYAIMVISLQVSPHLMNFTTYNCL